MHWECSSGHSLLASFWMAQSMIGFRRKLHDDLCRLQVLSMKESYAREFQSFFAGSVHCMNLDAIDETFMLCGSTVNNVALYDTKTQKSVIKPVAVESVGRDRLLVSSVDWFPNDCGMFLASSVGGNVGIFDTKHFEKVLDFMFDGKRVLEGKFRPHFSGGLRQLFAVALEEGAVALGDLRSGDCEHRIAAHTLDTSSVDWHPFEEHQLLSAGMDGSVKVWDVRRIDYQLPLLSLDWTQQLLINDHENHSRATFHSNKRSRVLDSQKAHESAVLGARYSPCGACIVSLARDSCRVWSRNGKLLQTFADIRSNRSFPFRLQFANFSRAHDALLVLPGAIIAGRDCSREVLLLPLDSVSGRPIKTLKGHTASVSCASFSNIGPRVYSASADARIVEWSGDECLDEFNAKKSVVRSTNSWTENKGFCDKQTGRWIYSNSSDALKTSPYHITQRSTHSNMQPRTEVQQRHTATRRKLSIRPLSNPTPAVTFAQLEQLFAGEDPNNANQSCDPKLNLTSKQH